MAHLPHDLHEDFPEAAAKIHELKSNDPRFAKLAEAYHEMNGAVHRMETGAEAVADEVLEKAKKQRLEIKDQIARLLA